MRPTPIPYPTAASSSSQPLRCAAAPMKSIAHSQRMRRPCTSLPLPFEKQNRVVTLGSTKASNTSPTGRRANGSASAP